MSDSDREHTVLNIVGAMSGIAGPKRDEIIQLQLTHFHKADPELAREIARGLAFDFKP